jgi:hypothetical protein
VTFETSGSQVAVCFVYDTRLVGTKREVKWFKKGVKERFGYSDLGKIRKHLNFDENEEKYLEATVPKMVSDIIKLYEFHIGQPVKEIDVPKWKN